MIQWNILNVWTSTTTYKANRWWTKCGTESVDDDVFHWRWAATTISRAPCWVLLCFRWWSRYNFAVCCIPKYEFIKLICCYVGHKFLNMLKWYVFMFLLNSLTMITLCCICSILMLTVGKIWQILPKNTVWHFVDWWWLAFLQSKK